MKRVIGYIRVSTDNQDLERQRVLIRKYCENKGYSLLRIEEDYAISGTVSDRNGLNNILNITNSIADMVVVSELSRLSRQDDIYETLTQIHLIIRNVDLVILDEPDKVYEAGKTINLADFLMLAIKAYGAADERKKIVSRMATGKYSKLQAFPLMRTDGNVPTGFKAVPNPDYIRGATPKMLLVEDKESMDMVKDIFNYISNGLSLGQTAKKLNMLGYRTSKGNPFNAQAVRYVINDPIYNGVRHWKGMRLEIPVKFISDEIWNLAHKKVQENKKGRIRYLLNERMTLTPADLLEIFEGHNLARKKLKSELELFTRGERNVDRYREAGITWWDYCGKTLVNSYPTYLERLPPLIDRINREKRNSKNYVLFLGETGVESNQAPCLSLVQFQIEDGELVISAYQRSSDANLGLPADIYHLYSIARQIELPLKSITLTFGNVHVYENNIENTYRLLSGEEGIRFELNV